MNSAQKVVDKMMDDDAFSQWLGIEVLEITSGFCKLQMTVRKEMTNGFKIAHGGITYSLADSCLAFAANSYGRQAVSIETRICHLHKVMSGDTLTVVSKEDSLGCKTAKYTINITNQKNTKVALFRGTVLFTGKDWFTKNLKL